MSTSSLPPCGTNEYRVHLSSPYGIAIPHAKCDIVEGLVAALGIKKGGVDFDSLDGKPSEIFVMTLSPTKRAGPHVQFLAEISRLLNDGSVREQIINATTKEEVVSILSL